jgi:hypothetical protein
MCVDLRRIFWLGAGAVVALAAVVAITGVVRGRFGTTDARMLVSLFAVLLCGSTALAALALLERGGAPAVAWTVLAGTPVALFFLFLATWTWQDEGPNRWGEAAWTAFLGTLAALVVTTLRLLLHERRLVRTVWAVVLFCAPTAAAIAAALIWTNGGHDTLGRAAAVLAIVSGAGYLIGPIAERALSR